MDGFNVVRAAPPEHEPGRKRPLVHIPIYCAQDATVYDVEYMTELALACLDSYFAHGNDSDLLVTSNDLRPIELLTEYRDRAGNRFDLLHVSRAELSSAFRVDEGRLSDKPCTKMIFSKFYPLLIRFHECIVHLDFNTLIMGRVDWEPLFAADIGLVRSLAAPVRIWDRFRKREGLWFPDMPTRSLFRIDSGTARPRATWINSGVFSVQGRGFDLLRSELDHYLAHLDQAIGAGLNHFPDELMMNALSLRETMAVSLLDDHNYNFLAYKLCFDRAWTKTCQILHFHGLKPNLLRAAASGEAPAPSQWRGKEARISRKLRLGEPVSSNMPRVKGNKDFHLAGMKWFRHLHAAARYVNHEFPMLRAVPLDVANREHARLCARLGY